MKASRNTDWESATQTPPKPQGLGACDPIDKIGSRGRFGRIPMWNEVGMVFYKMSLRDR